MNVQWPVRKWTIYLFSLNLLETKKVFPTQFSVFCGELEYSLKTKTSLSVFSVLLLVTYRSSWWPAKKCFIFSLAPIKSLLWKKLRHQSGFRWKKLKYYYMMCKKAENIEMVKKTRPQKSWNQLKHWALWYLKTGMTSSIINPRWL